MINPREISPGSNMPPYPHLASVTIDFSKTSDKLRAMRSIGVPYRPEQIQAAEEEAKASASAIAAGLAKNAGVTTCDQPADGCQLAVNSQLVALIAYLQRLGRVPQPESLAEAQTGEAGR